MNCTEILLEPTVFFNSKPYLVNLISKDTHLVFSIYWQALRCQQAFSKPCLVFDIKRHSPSILFFHGANAMNTKNLICVHINCNIDCQSMLAEGRADDNCYEEREKVFYSVL